jgi:hypothetical protein
LVVAARHGGAGPEQLEHIAVDTHRDARFDAGVFLNPAQDAGIHHRVYIGNIELLLLFIRAGFHRISVKVNLLIAQYQ